ncbi:DUF3025 domain-containing protein [Cupriavidus oxalaticus]|uniref:DUF3025 domain-containing protein n=1 Tax=Cupriavidus oxalaticus TaxID=96344 RepID=A0A375G9P0_9BURK|nr:DUF3025 domain-containing protein [Cupriavidus oxalaticus]QEZ45604.1 DUF3025 domain-containing protein [Cupriavidus oxalaticus]QRQ86980.1 DUF3025 domain-containing protein [Cupriavidus oxalaticus]QRQ94692.1 DUF3025 domain-containing protein [Cupriavidus oxalaticus]WQD83340.1 DUF3025 domain-containing protein [Cupriavidus oxalaticus]SPC16095.1 conserved hypothetical protein [Cupriavidus oxalaticus]
MPAGATAAGESFAAALAGIEWSRPWFQPFAPRGAALAAAVQGGADLRALLDTESGALGLHNGRGLPLRFVPQLALPEGSAYEAHIDATGEVPTRDNLHDFFNALVWLHFPQAKRVLNRIQATVIAREGVRTTRGGVRDAATLFDENAVLFLGEGDEHAEALRGFAWQQLFVTQRHVWDTACRVVPFGHALLEKLVQPYKAVTAHAWTLPLVADGALDKAVALSLQDAAAAGALRGGRCFAPLPVMGIPGWCDDNASPDFYADTTVFRPGRMRDLRRQPD